MIRPVRDRATFAALSGARRLRHGPVWLRCTDVGASDVGGDPRVAYTVPRSVGNAVERNRVRRRLRAAVADCEHDLRAGVAYLFGADRRVLHAPFPVVDRAVRELVRASREMTS